MLFNNGVFLFSRATYFCRERLFCSFLLIILEISLCRNLTAIAINSFLFYIYVFLHFRFHGDFISRKFHMSEKFLYAFNKIYAII